MPGLDAFHPNEVRHGRASSDDVVRSLVVEETARKGTPVAAMPASIAAFRQAQALHDSKRFAEAEVPQPEYEICSGAEEAIQAAERIGFPCVIKAPDRQGQRGLTLVRSSDEVAGAVRVALDASRTATLLVEEHVPGREVTVNAFSSGGHFYPLTVTDRLTAPLPAFGVALTHVWPSELAPAEIGAAGVVSTWIDGERVFEA